MQTSVHFGPCSLPVCLAASGLCSGRDNKSYLFSPGLLGLRRCCVLLCHTLVQCVVPHIAWTCGIIWAFKISCYAPILLCRLKGCCYQSVPHWEAVSPCRSFSALLKLPKYSKSFLDAGSRAVCAEVFAVAIFFPICFQTVHNAHFAARAQTGNIPPCWH